MQDDPQNLAESLYRQNVEISGKNKTLSLLSKLYQTSILNLAPKDMAARVCSSIQTDMGFEVVEIFLWKENKKKLQPLSLATSARSQKIQAELKFALDLAEAGIFLYTAAENKTFTYTEHLKQVWKVSDAQITYAADEGHLKSCFAYPLVIESSVIGIILFALNRGQDNLAAYEKEILERVPNVVAVALDRAMLYERLKIANENLKALDAARSEFITIASHQLRTPPATIKWYLSAILAGDYGKIKKEAREIIEKTNRTNNSLISLIDDMLNVSRIERGKMEFLFEKTDLLPLAKITYEQLLPQSIEKNLKLSFKAQKKTLPKIMADKEKIRQVMNNLIDNAIKYTKQGGIAVKLWQEGSNINFSVTDTGKGITLEEQGAIFQKFNRGKESSKQSAGLGLGLYVAKIVIEQHHGKIWAESKGPGQGSIFSFSLPIHSTLKETTLLDLSKP